MVYSIVFTDRSVEPEAVTLITDDRVFPDFEGAQDMMHSREHVLNTLEIDTKAVESSSMRLKIPEQSIIVYSYDDPPPPTRTTGLRTEFLPGPWTIETCTDLVKRLNNESVVIAPDYKRFQVIKLLLPKANCQKLVLPPKSELSKAIKQCILEISEAQAMIDKATTTLDTINTDV